MATLSDSKLFPVKPAHQGAETRIKSILDAADMLLKTSKIEHFSILPVARVAGLANSSVYHFFPSAEAILVGLLRRYFVDLDSVLVDSLANAPPLEWHCLIRYLFEKVRIFYTTRPVAAHLAFHTGGYGGLQLEDSQHIERIAHMTALAFQARYHIPLIDYMEQRVAIALAISDRIWAIDVRDGKVSDFHFEESQRAVISYLSNFLPPVVAHRHVSSAAPLGFGPASLQAVDAIE